MPGSVYGARWSFVRELSGTAETLSFRLPVTHVYNPLDYAAAPLRRYLDLYGKPPREILLIGMNPGPFGMAQTGIPFGDVACVRDWLNIEGVVARPPQEHPKRPVAGFACARIEVSGTRLWGWARDRFGTPEHFFARFFVWNYCPLCFMTASGANLTPDKLPPAERGPLFDACDRALRAMARLLQPAVVAGVGAFAERRIRAALPEFVGRIGRIPHPSPASPAANRGWATAAETALAGLDVSLP